MFTDPTGSHIVVAGAARTISLLNLQGIASNMSSLDPASFDVLGAPVCEQLPCLMFQQVITEVINQPISENTPPNVVSGIFDITWSNESWVAHTRLSSSELLCIVDVPATRIPDPGPDDAHQYYNGAVITGLTELEIFDPPCQSLAFEITDSSGDLDMFLVLPEISSDGTLRYQQAVRGFGRARFNVSVLDSSGGQYASSFVIVIVPTLPAITFEIGSMLQVDAVPFVPHEITFALNFMQGQDGLTAASIPYLRWTAHIENPSIFASDPRFSFRYDVAGGVVGVMTFDIEVFESGSSVIHVTCSMLPPPSTAIAGSVFGDDDAGDLYRSKEVAFIMTARSRNYRPTVGTASELITVEGAGGDSGLEDFPCWVRNLSTGSPYELWQSLDITETNVTVLEGMFTRADIQLRVIPNLEAACVDVQLISSANANGVLRFTFAIQDNGSGENLEYMDLVVRIEPSNNIPMISHIGHIELNESRSMQEIDYGSFFQIAAPPADELSQATRFVVDANLDGSAQDVFASFRAQVASDGSLSLTVPPFLYGIITLRVHLEEDFPSAVSAVDKVHITIWRIPPALSFELISFYAAVESTTGVHRMDLANVTGTENATFSVVISNPSIFKNPPSAGCTDAQCHLVFELAALRHGTSTLSVTLSGASEGSESTASPLTKVLVLKVLPSPIITKVSPEVIHPRGGARVTIHGRHFGSLYSRTYHSLTYGNLSVTIGGGACTNLLFTSDGIVTCTAPAGYMGKQTVHLNITDGKFVQVSKNPTFWKVS